MGGVTATALTQRRERRVVAQLRLRGSPGLIVAQVSAFFYTHMPPSSRGVGGGSGCSGCKKRIGHSDNVVYVKFQ
jgi:hypothetical protein